MVVPVLYSGDFVGGDTLWPIISTLSYVAFGVIGVGTLVGSSPPAVSDETLSPSARRG